MSDVLPYDDDPEWNESFANSIDKLNELVRNDMIEHISKRWSNRDCPITEDCSGYLVYRNTELNEQTTYVNFVCSQCAKVKSIEV